MGVHSQRVRCVVRYEIGGVGYDPYAISPDGDRGPGQLNPHGKLPDFRRWAEQQGVEPDEFNPFLVLDYMETRGLQTDPGAWTPISRGLCT